MTNHLVSIVVPSFNHGRFISKMIDSVLLQSYKNWELIIVDNNSTDDTDEIISSYRDNRIRIFKINNNGIIAISRNKGIKKAKGDWIAFLDSDDAWFPDKLEKCLQVAEKADLIYHNMILYLADQDILSKRIIKSRKLKQPIFKDLLIRGNTILNSSVIVRKCLLEKVGSLNENKNIITSEDYHLWLKIAQITNRFVLHPYPLGYYAVHGKGMSQRDTSLQLRKSVSEFLSTLSTREKYFVESFVRYSKIRTLVHTGINEPYFNDLLFCIRNGTFDIKLRSIFSMFQILILDATNFRHKWQKIKIWKKIVE